jgi:predicted small lipoprotein YifL
MQKYWKTSVVARFNGGERGVKGRTRFGSLRGALMTSAVLALLPMLAACGQKGALKLPTAQPNVSAPGALGAPSAANAASSANQAASGATR